jgi:hypothetical protein
VSQQLSTVEDLVQEALGLPVENFSQLDQPEGVPDRGQTRTHQLRSVVVVPRPKQNAVHQRIALHRTRVSKTAVLEEKLVETNYVV